MKYTEDNLEFDSKIELKHYQMLKAADNVTILSVHPELLLQDNVEYRRMPDLKKAKTRKIKYTPDFIIHINGIDKPVAFETKGFARKDYMMRKKLFIAKYRNSYYFYECTSQQQLEKDLERWKKRENKTPR